MAVPPPPASIDADRYEELVRTIEQCIIQRSTDIQILDMWKSILDASWKGWESQIGGEQELFALIQRIRCGVVRSGR